DLPAKHHPHACPPEIEIRQIDAEVGEIVVGLLFLEAAEIADIAANADVGRKHRVDAAADVDAEVVAGQIIDQVLDVVDVRAYQARPAADVRRHAARRRAAHHEVPHERRHARLDPEVLFGVEEVRRVPEVDLEPDAFGLNAAEHPTVNRRLRDG